MLDTMREECERKILEMKGEEKRGMYCYVTFHHSYAYLSADEAEVRQENKRLMAVIDMMKYVHVLNIIHTP